MAPKLLLYTGYHGFQIQQHVTELFSSAFPHIQLCIIFWHSCRISSFFCFKDCLPFGLRSYVIYEFTHQCCQELCVGEGCLLLYTRISGHIGILAYTGKPLSHTTLSSILAHMKMSHIRISSTVISTLNVSWLYFFLFEYVLS